MCVCVACLCVRVLHAFEYVRSFVFVCDCIC